VQNHRGSGTLPTCGPYGAKNATAGSPYYTHTSTYQYNPQTGARPALEFPAVPYGPTDFHCDRSLNSYTDVCCFLVSLSNTLLMLLTGALFIC